jgi:glyoxylase-like metal-dependent hydrolase (beta-lactamase superfamily II)
VLLHLGDNEWCVVDSCIARGRTEPVAVKYLRLLDALNNVKLVIATHWHDDHITGLASILKLVPQAKFCCSMALKHDEFLTLVSGAPEAITGRSGVEEFAYILMHLENYGHKAPIFAVENKRLLHLPGPGRTFPLSLVILSPSNPTIKLALQEIAGLLPKPGEPQRRIINQSPNHASVVLWVEAGD